MALILDGNAEIVVHARSNLCYLICLRHLIRSKAGTNWIFSSSPNRPIFLHACATCSSLLSNKGTIEENKTVESRIRMLHAQIPLHTVLVPIIPDSDMSARHGGGSVFFVSTYPDRFQVLINPESGSARMPHYKLAKLENFVKRL